VKLFFRRGQKKKKKKSWGKLWVFGGFFFFGKKIDTCMKSKKVKYNLFLKFKILNTIIHSTLSKGDGAALGCPITRPIFFPRLLGVLDTNVCWGITWRAEGENIQ
jgi:hypothetical protein